MNDFLIKYIDTINNLFCLAITVFRHLRQDKSRQALKIVPHVGLNNQNSMNNEEEIIT